ncbi:hypothetical protein ACFC36_12200 [Streptomyces rubiginosohelvolus]|uniref:hypothetical protein n=1 Tax=Streptomyces rubiginosohelvolus TaxID=67362 RepID=UPI0035D60259
MVVEVCGLSAGGGRSGAGAVGRPRPRFLGARRSAVRDRHGPGDVEPRRRRLRRPVLAGLSTINPVGLRVALGAPFRAARAVRRPGFRSVGDRTGTVLPGGDRERHADLRRSRFRAQGRRTGALFLPFRFA